jgi:hypothetical protein
MIAVKGVKGSMSCPSSAQLLSSIPRKPANISPDHGDLEHRGKGHNLGDGDTVLLPRTHIVTKPAGY